ncbi:MAG: TonB-dependent receptor, partial [Silvibacterium sp.]
AGVQEFKVLQSNFSPEYGESGDGIVSLTVKSGTNDFHGSAYDFFRNRALDANSWTNDTASLPKSVDTQNDFGATIGGPVRIPHLYNGKDRTFFFADYEGFRFRSGGTALISAPNEAFRQGNFSAELPTTQIYDPTTHAAIPGNVLTNDPNFTPSSVMTKVFALLPATNGNLTNNVVNTSISSTTADIWDLKIDQVLSAKHRISGGLDWDDTDAGGVSNLGPIFGSSTPQVTRYARVSDNYVISDSIVNQVLFGFARRFRTEASNTLGGNYPEKIGLKGVSPVTFPCMLFIGTPYVDLLNNCGDSQYADNVYQLNESLTWAKGKHIFKFGGEDRALQFNVRRLTYSSGEFNFMSAETAAANGTGGDAVASSLFGLSDTTYLVYGTFSGIRYKNYSAYAQDTYKLTPKLVLNYGLRWDLDIPASEAFDRFSMVDPTLPNPGAGNIPGAYTYYGSGPGRNGKTRPQNIYPKSFGPRLGFAYSINDKTVLRGGYGIFYEPLKEGSFADQDSLGFFNVQTVTPTNGGPTQIDNGVTRIFPDSGPFTPQGQNGNSGVIMVPANTGRPSDVQSWNLDVQRQVTANLLVSVAYVGSKGTHLVALNIIPNQVNPSYLALGADLTANVTCLTDGSCPNAIAAGVKLPYPGFTGLINQAVRPFPQYGDFNQEDNSFSPDRTGDSTYHAMQMQINKRMARGLNFLVSYTVSKILTDADASGPGAAGFTGTNEYIGQNSYDRKAEKAVSELDTPQSLVTSLFYELPVGHGKTYLNKAGPVNTVVGGWFVSGIGTYHSGSPTEVYAPCGGTAGDVLFAGCHFTGVARANVVPGVPQANKSNFQPGTTPFWNPAAFTAPGPLTFGDEPRSLSSARFFATKDEDVTLGKKTGFFDGKIVADFRAEFFDILNRHIYMPDVGGSLVGTPFVPAGGAGCAGVFACGFGAVTSASGPRTVQFGLNISY